MNGGPRGKHGEVILGYFKVPSPQNTKMNDGQGCMSSHRDSNRVPSEYKRKHRGSIEYRDAKGFDNNEFYFVGLVRISHGYT
jgi:hypothetical protein